MRSSCPFSPTRQLPALTLALILACSSSPQPPKPRDDPALANLTALLKLDPDQQKKTRQLLQELAARTIGIQQKWDRGAKVHPQELLASRSIFQRDFLAILTEEQQRIYAGVLLKLQMKGNRPRSPW